MSICFDIKKYINPKVILILLMVFFLVEVIFMDVLDDILGIIIFLNISFVIGMILCKNKSFLTQVIIGMGLVGISAYYCLLFRISNVSVYFAILGILLYYGRITIFKQYRDFLKKIVRTNFFRENIYSLILVTILLIIYTYIAVTPETGYDALVKHIPFILDLSQMEHIPNNFFESLVYGEVSLMRYTLSYFILFFSSYQSIKLFELAILFIICMQSNRIIDMIIFEKNKNRIHWASILAIILCPLCIDRVFHVNVDLLPTIFFLEAVVLFFKNNIYDEIPYLALLFGMTMFSKMTLAPYLLTLGVFILGKMIIQYKTKKSNMATISKSLLLGILFFCICFATPCFVNFFNTGNPVFPFFNSFFKSEYFPTVNFADPFDKNPLKFDLKSWWNLIFYSSRNIEMSDGALGMFLLFFPIACVYRIVLLISQAFKKSDFSKKEIVFLLYILSSYYCAILFTSNIRYLLPVFILAAMYIEIEISNFFFRFIISRSIKNMVYGTIIILFIAPSIGYFVKYQSFQLMNHDYKKLTNNRNDEVLRHINSSENSVLSYGDPFKGEYQGDFYNFNWYNTYLNHYILEGKLDIGDYIQKFDYFLVNNNSNSEVYGGIEQIFLNKFPEIKKNLNLVYQGNGYDLFKVNKEEKTVELNKTFFENGSIVNVDEPQVVRIENSYKKYRINIVSKKNTTAETLGRFQINWYDDTDRLIEVSLSRFQMGELEQSYTSEIINSPNDAAYGLVLINSDTKDEVFVRSFRIEGIYAEDIDEYIQMILNN